MENLRYRSARLLEPWRTGFTGFRLERRVPGCIEKRLAALVGHHVKKPIASPPDTGSPRLSRDLRAAMRTDINKNASGLAAGGVICNGARKLSWQRTGA